LIFWINNPKMNQKPWTPRYYYILRNKTSGKKYIGQTKRDITKYLGSGSYWKAHCKKHGGYNRENIETIWFKKFESEEKARIFLEEFESENAQYWLSENKEWANQTKENTLDTPVMEKENIKKTAETKRRLGLYPEIGRKISASLTGKKNKKCSESRKGKVSCYDLDGNYHYVTVEEFRNRDDLVGLQSGKSREISEEEKKSISVRNKNRVWVHRGEEKKFIRAEEISSHISEGFTLGGGKFKPRTKGVCEKCLGEFDLSNLKRWHGLNCKRIS